MIKELSKLTSYNGYSARLLTRLHDSVLRRFDGATLLIHTAVLLRI